MPTILYSAQAALRQAAERYQHDGWTFDVFEFNIGLPGDIVYSGPLGPDIWWTADAHAGLARTREVDLEDLMQLLPRHNPRGESSGASRTLQPSVVVASPNAPHWQRGASGRFVPRHSTRRTPKIHATRTKPEEPVAVSTASPKGADTPQPVTTPIVPQAGETVSAPLPATLSMNITSPASIGIRDTPGGVKRNPLRSSRKTVSYRSHKKVHSAPSTTISTALRTVTDETVSAPVPARQEASFSMNITRSAALVRNTPAGVKRISKKSRRVTGISSSVASLFSLTPFLPDAYCAPHTWVAPHRLTTASPRPPHDVIVVTVPGEGAFVVGRTNYKRNRLSCEACVGLDAPCLSGFGRGKRACKLCWVRRAPCSIMKTRDAGAKPPSSLALQATASGSNVQTALVGSSNPPPHAVSEALPLDLPPAAKAWMEEHINAQVASRVEKALDQKMEEMEAALLLRVRERIATSLASLT
ncbi:hypothetical protein FA95DRAFT_1559433 [Auriscalpium vulgare]|uniref:Uncharacterized protein n=1 Tax=Auriscalpium vulgare TaxID=40419 RepID=A0ACB8RT62_9AGAM|nr:hypothetical protein FA95DRAFT_1559433 [Auriscalpium vulgare]